MIVLFTDFGSNGPYIGQMQAVLRQRAPQVPVIDLLNNAPAGNPQLSAYLLAALRHSFPKNSIFLSVVDPGVGGARRAVVVLADGQYFVGPDNGLFNTVAVLSEHHRWWEIIWKPAVYSNSFHGRDLFAPVAACLAEGSADNMLAPASTPDLRAWPADLRQIIYFDHYGNAVTGLRYQNRLSGKPLRINDVIINQADTFCSVPKGHAFWYQNSSGLVEIAVNQGRAEQQLALSLGMELNFR